MDRAHIDTADSHWNRLCRIGGTAALMQLVCSLITMVVVFTLGAEPGAANEYFEVLQNNRLVGLLRLDFPSVVTMALYYLTFSGLYSALRRTNGAYAALAVVIASAGITLWLARHSAFSMIYLGDQYAAATTEAQKFQFLAAGEAIIASDMWHSTSGFVAGLLLESAAVLISVVMLRSEFFNKATAYVGILTHGFDLIHVIVNLFLPGKGDFLMIVAGPLYPIWFFLVGRGLFRLTSKE